MSTVRLWLGEITHTRQMRLALTTAAGLIFWGSTFSNAIGQTGGDSRPSGRPQRGFFEGPIDPDEELRNAGIPIPGLAQEEQVQRMFKDPKEAEEALRRFDHAPPPIDPNAGLDLARKRMEESERHAQEFVKEVMNRPPPQSMFEQFYATIPWFWNSLLFWWILVSIVYPVHFIITGRWRLSQE